MKSNLRLFIEQVVEQELAEMAVNPSQADAQELALTMHTRGTGVKTFILYRPEVFRQTFNQPATGNMAHQVIVGIISIAPNPVCKTWNVQYAAGQKGYGPMMYDIAFSYTGEQGMAPDRGLVSPDARRVWAYNFNDRKSDFKIIPLEDAFCQFKDDDNSGKDSFLDYKYVLKNHVNTDSLEDRSTDVLAALTPDAFTKPLARLLDLAIRYFQDRNAR